MANRRKKKKSLSQRVAGVATAGIPSPLRKISTSRLGAGVLLILLPLLVITGILGVDWSGGRPRLKLDWARAKEVREEAKERIGDDAGRLKDGLADIGGRLRGTQVSSASLLGEADPERIRIATFNIQVLGESKARKDDVMEILATVIQQFDVVAIQELRTKNPEVMEKLVNLANAGGRNFRYIVGPRLGRTVSKEQYVYVFDSERIDMDADSIVTIADPGDLLHREPLLARFHVKAPPGIQGFSFILVNIHTDPDETDTELDALDDVFVAAQQNPWGEDDIILLGDLNVDHEHFGQLGQLPDIAYIVHGQPTNTRGNKSYDNIVYNQRATIEYTGKSGIMDLESTFDIDRDKALEVSDHLPVWAEFSIQENGVEASIASRLRDRASTPTPAAD